jgi:hypothetical protein
MDKTKMANQVWETLFKDRRKVSSHSSHQESNPTRIRSHDQSQETGNKAGKTICQTAKNNSEENKSL